MLGSSFPTRCSADVWADVGLNGGLATIPLYHYRPNSATETYGMFKEHVLEKGDYKDTVKEQPGSSSVVQGVASDVGGIGYSGVGYKTSGVKAISLGEKAGEFFEPSLENSLSGDYPLARFLYIYVNKKPNEPLDQLTMEFVKYALSKEGQNIVVKDGYYPLPATVASASVTDLK
jgi:phosphate transport system substrate-binding protein